MVDSLINPYEEIESATNNFSDANLIAQGSCYMVYKGQLLLDSSSGELINIVARRTQQFNVVVNELNSSSEELINIVARRRLQFTVLFNEVILSQYLNHKNISSIFKIARNDYDGIMINKHEANGSLDKHLQGSTLTWMQRLKICLGVAHALSYLHNRNIGDGDYIIHGNIKSSKILLDHNWEPKLHGFGYGAIVKKNHGYFTSKHNAPSIQNGDNWYFARLARLHYQETTLDHMIHPDLRKQMDLQSLKIFSEVAYYCLKEQRGERPDMDQIVKRLETALELQQKHQTPKEHLTPKIGATLSNYLEGKNLDHLKIRLSDIELATNKFSSTNYIGQGGYGMVYKAELNHFDSTKSSAATEGNNKGDFSKRRSTVAIKRLFSRQDGQEEQGFSTEIEMLANCKHPNIVSLLGFCEEGLERILIYEYVTNESLSDYLGNVNNITNLTWAQRIQICIDIANGLNYLHTSTQKKPMIIHRDIKSDNILLDDNWVAKIADFGLSKLHPPDAIASTINTVNIAGTEVYLDPEYMKTGKLKKESDIYSFGVVLFEILCGRLAYDESYNFENEKGLSSTVQRRFSEGTLKNLVDPKLKETHENIFGLNGGLNQDSLDTFMNIAYRCLANTQTHRPTTKVIIEELEKALNFQKNSKDNLQISLRDIKLATQNFSDDMCIGEGRYWKQYEGEITHANANVCTIIVAKRFNSKSIQGHHQFLVELNALSEYKHENIVALVGYCHELDENVIVFEHASNGSLDKHLDNGSLSWMKRLKICIDIASGLEFLHRKENMIHRDIKSASIEIDGDWKAKISNWERLSTYTTLGQIYIHLSGRLASSFIESTCELVQRCKQSEQAVDELVFADIKGNFAPQSLTTFFELARACLESKKENRPHVDEVVIRLKKALELQEDYEIWEPKLPKDYEQIILMSNTPEIYSNETKKDLYGMFTSKGILLQQGKLCFILGSNGERNEMISATNFSYKNRSLRKWQMIPKSRFPKVAQMLDIMNLKIQIKIKTQLLSPGVNYVVHLIFKFRRPKKSSAKLIYVNLKYKMGRHDLHAYFARRREDGWMTIELSRFLNQKKDTDFEVLLESFSRCYCGRRWNCVYVEGVEFRAIDNVKYEEIEQLEDVQHVLKSCSKVQQFPIDWPVDQFFSLNVVFNGKKHLRLSAIGFLYDSSKLKPFHVRPSDEPRFQVIVELLPQQVFGIKCKIGCQLLSPDTDYVCYLVFKLSEKCSGLHCPVRVRNVLQWKNKEIGLVRFRPPSPWTSLHDTTWIPKEREDGWMEVIVWKFNSTGQIRNGHVPMHLKLITYEGTMSGLIVSGLEIRSI